MPKKIQIGPFVYSVKCDDAAKTVLNSDHGETDGARLEIRINPDSAELVQREVLLHESLHAIAAVAGLDHELGEELEEKIVIAEAKSKEENVKIVEKFIVKQNIIKEKGDEVIRYIDKEIVKYDVKFAPGGQCEIPKEFVDVINKAAKDIK